MGRTVTALEPAFLRQPVTEPEPVPESERDQLLKALAQCQEEAAQEVGDRKRELEEAVKAFDAWEKPKKDREAAAMRFEVVHGSYIAQQADLKRRIEEAQPDYLRSTIANLKSELAYRAKHPGRLANAESAVRELEKLAFQPGDLRPAIKKILTTLTQADVSLL